MNPSHPHGHVGFAPLPPPPLSSRQPQTDIKPKKLRRISQACDFCHKRSIKCKPSEDNPNTCQNCNDFGESCTYDRPKKKRGIKSGSTRSAGRDPNSHGGSQDGERDARMLLELNSGGSSNGSFYVAENFVLPERLKDLILANENKINVLVHVYFEVVYPIFPLFHRSSLLSSIKSRQYLTDHSFFADTMSICALASARAQDRALFPGRWDLTQFHVSDPEVFFNAAREALPQEMIKMRGLDWMRTCAILALYGIQVGKIDIMHQYLSMYHGLVSMDGLQDEKNWPKSIGIVETELRRRLFWSMYTLEVFSSIVWNTPIRVREAHARVEYTTEVDDEHFSDKGIVPSYNPQSAKNPSCWLHGWNFITDQYRIIEHAMDTFNRRTPTTPGPFSLDEIFGSVPIQQNIYTNKIKPKFDRLPSRFKEAKMPESGETSGDEIFSFQAANITATLQLVRMILFTSEDATVDQKCDIARDLLDAFGNVPVPLLRAISSPLLHHLAGIGSILGSVFEKPLSEHSYQKVRTILLNMANLLAGLEEGITRTVGAAFRLRTQVKMIDNYMVTQRQQSGSFTIPILSNPASQPTGGNDNNANIDPSLQSPVPNISYPPQPIPYNYAAAGPAVATGVNGPIQLPQNLLEGWPWPFDASQGLGGSFNGGY